MNERITRSKESGKETRTIALLEDLLTSIAGGWQAKARWKTFCRKNGRRGKERNGNRQMTKLFL